MKPLNYLGQGLAYTLFAVVLGYFSTSPEYLHISPGQALVKLSFTHAAQRKGACRERTGEELAKLKPNMRVQKDCPRERADVVVELEMDGKQLYHVVLPPPGLAHDGAASIYRRLQVPAGTHRFVARLKDKVEGDFDFVRNETVTLAAGHVLVIDFKADVPGAPGFMFKN
ncbi:MAG: hypothetical protein HY846_00055 [Nitrosomonadales bacterium]|nr:hypothetical protein [Nitrosomonadales bacterium]